jgi:hypothetical protein
MFEPNTFTIERFLAYQSWLEKEGWPNASYRLIQIPSLTEVVVLIMDYASDENKDVGSHAWIVPPEQVKAVKIFLKEIDSVTGKT